MNEIENKIKINEEVLETNIENIQKFMKGTDFKKQLQLMKNIEDILDYTFKLANIFENKETMKSFVANQKENASANFSKDYDYFKAIHDKIVEENSFYGDSELFKPFIYFPNILEE